MTLKEELTEIANEMRATAKKFDAVMKRADIEWPELNEPSRAHYVLVEDETGGCQGCTFFKDGLCKVINDSSFNCFGGIFKKKASCNQ